MSRTLIICAQEEPCVRLYTVLTSTLTPEAMEHLRTRMHGVLYILFHDEDELGEEDAVLRPMKASLEILDCGEGWSLDLMDLSTRFHGTLILADWA